MWGFSGFRPLQREAMHAILESRDSVVVLPTGGGKSLCFQAPALVPARTADPSGPRRRARGVAAHLADEGSGRRPARRRRRGVVPEQHAAAARARRGARERARAAAGCCTCRRSGSSARGVSRCGGCCSRRTCGSSRSTRRTASANGVTTSARSTASSDGCATIFPACRCTRSRRPPPNACGATSSPSCGCRRRSCSSARSTGPTSLPRAATREPAPPAHRHPLAARTRRGHRVLLVAPRGRVARRMAAGRGPPRGAVSRRPRPPRSAAAIRNVSRRARGHRRGDGRVRHGHRSVERALRRARRRAAIARALPAGVGPRRPRRPAGRVRADLLGRRLRALAADARVQRRVERERPVAAARHGGATPRARAAVIARWSSTSASRTSAPSAARATGA